MERVHNTQIYDPRLARQVDRMNLRDMLRLLRYVPRMLSGFGRLFALW